ncbi:hypothetical protein [Microseira sp. BLCC-F43]|jgi:hypothetical protein|uniref:hypothetical protein n=1 Tax=Microseira sp. BLCC-F43 TaxID=3153602 RepID=UPI0035B8B9B5
MHSEAETFAFIDECKYALDQLFQILDIRLKAIHNLSRSLAEIEQIEYLLTDNFVEQDQWSVNANSYYIQYMDRMKALAEEKQGIATEPERQKRVLEMLARIGATEESMAVLASAVLQIGKQVLSFRFGGKPNLKNVREVASQLVVEIIWEGRNHTMHWEEANPRRPVVDMLQKLQTSGVKIIQGRNNALAIIAVLNWKSASEAIEDLKSLVIAENT